jgi:Holliday junction resolvase-like predicted endonuclease
MSRQHLKPKDPRHQLGEESENTVVKYFEQKNFALKARRWRTPFGEIDLLLQSKAEGLWLVEVKSVGAFAGETVISRAQEKRLQRAAEYVFGLMGEFPHCVLAAVNHEGQVELIPL